MAEGGAAPGEPAAGFVATLFRGALASGVVLPFPDPDPETAEISREVGAMVTDWAAAAIDPAAIDGAADIPESVVEGLAELGLLGLTIPEEHGGSGCSQHTYTTMMEALARRCPSTATILGAHLGLGLKGLIHFGTEEQKARWLPRAATGELMAAFALTEPQAGSDAAALRTTAEPQSNGSWKLDGSKVWITNGSRANLFTVFARTPDPERPDAPVDERPISAFVVTRDLGGLSTGAEESKMGLKGSSTTEVHLEDVPVPADHLLGAPGQGFRIALEILNGGRHSLAACCLGQARLARDLAVAHAAERVQYSRPIAEFGMVREMLAGIEADVYAMEAGTYLAAGLVDRGESDFSLESACCKVHATERLWLDANDALQVAGGTGFMHEYPYERIVRDARVNLIFEGTNQVLRMMLALRGLKARAKLGPLPASERLEGVHAELDPEATACGAAAAELGRRAGEVLERRGADLRDAQHDQHRLADMAVALYGACAVLSRATARLAAGAAPERELPLARLAARRQLADFRRAAEACDRNDDALIDAVARGLARS